MAFQYQPYRSDLTGSIADLMLRGTEAQAEIARANGAIQARAAEQRGQTTQQMFGTIGQLAQGAIGQYRQDRLDAPRREMEQLQLRQGRREDAEAQRHQVREQWTRARLGDPTQPPPTPQELLENGYTPAEVSALHHGFAQITQDDLATQSAAVQAFRPDLEYLRALPEGMRAQTAAALGERWKGAPLPPGMVPTQFDDASLDALLKRTRKAHDPYTLHTGDVRYDEGDQIIARGPEAPPKTSAELAADAANPTSPTHEASAAALKLLKPAPAGPQSVQEYEYAKANGFKGTYEQYQTEDANRKRPVVNISNQPAAGDFDKTGEAFLATIPKEWRATVKKIAAYDEDPSKSVGLRSGMRDKVMQWVNQVNPAYKADEFSVRSPTRKAFTTGTQGQQINAINTAIGHIDQLTDVANDLQNGGFVPGNAAWNRVRSMFGAAEVTNFDTLKDALAGEVASVLSKGGATVSGIAEAKEKINAANSPQQLAGFVKTLIPVMGSKLTALDYQYHQAMGADDTYSALSPQSKMILAKHGFDPAQHDGRDRSTKGDPMGIR